MASLIQQSKFDAERTVFKQFAEKMSWPITDDLIENRPEPEPDILYKGFESPVAFELSEICAPEVADAISKACRPENNGVWFTATTDPTEYVLRKKVEAPHESLHPMDLLLYWNSRTASPDHLVEVEIAHFLEHLAQSKFNRIWYFGENEIVEFSSFGVILRTISI